MVQKIDRTLVQITTENLTALVAADFSGGRNFVEIDGLAVVVLRPPHLASSDGCAKDGTIKATEVRRLLFHRRPDALF